MFLLSYDKFWFGFQIVVHNLTTDKLPKAETAFVTLVEN